MPAKHRQSDNPYVSAAADYQIKKDKLTGVFWAGMVDGEDVGLKG